MAKNSLKQEFLQIRISKSDKETIKREAKRLSIDVSELILQRVLSQRGEKFTKLVRSMKNLGVVDASFQLAELHDMLVSLPRDSFSEELPGKDISSLDVVLANYIAAMIEFEGGKQMASLPDWVSELRRAPAPYFASTLSSLRLHLLLSSPPAFRRRNLFIDSATGSRV